jgi:predicted transcriptional regulator
VRFRDGALDRAQPAVAYQLKRIIDDQQSDMLYPAAEAIPADLRRHFAAQYFAACLTMPVELVERAWHQGQYEPQQLAKLFQTSPEAMLFRLRELHLIAAGSYEASPSL